MTREEARKNAEVLVYVHYTKRDIIEKCKALGIPTRAKGRLLDRATLEAMLVEKLAERFEQSNVKFNGGD